MRPANASLLLRKEFSLLSVESAESATH